MALAPVFLVIPLISVWNGLAGRVGLLLAGNANTIFTVWVLGVNSGSTLFLLPCAVLAAMSFRAPERCLKITITSLPLFIWLILQLHAPTGVHHYDNISARRIVVLNFVSVTVLISLFGWLKFMAMTKPRLSSALAFWKKD